MTLTLGNFWANSHPCSTAGVFIVLEIVPVVSHVESGVLGVAAFVWGVAASLPNSTVHFVSYDFFASAMVSGSFEAAFEIDVPIVGYSLYFPKVQNEVKVKYTVTQDIEEEEEIDDDQYE